MMLMLQTFLEARFKLTLHRETKVLPVYILSAAKNGLKLPNAKSVACEAPDPTRPSSASQPPAANQPAPTPCGRLAQLLTIIGERRMGKLKGKSVNMPELARVLETMMARPVVDKTGFKGTFDDIVNKPQQFVGFNATPNSSAQTFADAIEKRNPRQLRLDGQRRRGFPVGPDRRQQRLHHWRREHRRQLVLGQVRLSDLKFPSAGLSRIDRHRQWSSRHVQRPQRRLGQRRRERDRHKRHAGARQAPCRLSPATSKTRRSRSRSRPGPQTPYRIGSIRSRHRLGPPSSAMTHALAAVGVDFSAQSKTGSSAPASSSWGFAHRRRVDCPHVGPRTLGCRQGIPPAFFAA